MFNKIAFHLSTILIFSLSGCATSPESGAQNLTLSKNKTDTKTEEVLINICRPKNVVRIFESPDLFVNGQNKVELSNGTRVKILANVGDDLSFILKSNFLAQRFKDVPIFNNKIFENKELYLVLSTSKFDWEGGVDTLFMNPVVAGLKAQQRAREQGINANWWVSVVTEELFEAECS